MLGFIVLGAVLIVTLVFALAAYLIDRSEARLENGRTVSGTRRPGGRRGSFGAADEVLGRSRSSQV